MECKFCGKVCINDNGLRNHERLCKSNPNRQILKSNFINFNDKKKLGLIKGKNQFIKAEELGLPKPIVTEDTRKKISDKSKSRIYSEEQRKKHSISMKKAVELHPDSYTKNNVVGRVKNIIYNNVKLKGGWELLVAKWFDENEIKWEHETKYFEYEWNGVRRYYPDFYLPDYDFYVEVKGYQTERDDAKWLSVSNLIVIKSNDIKKIKNKTYKFDFI